jgi:hypothetical protein
MSEKDSGAIDQEAARRFQQHKDLAASELIAEGLVNTKEEYVIDAKYAKLRGVDKVGHPLNRDEKKSTEWIERMEAEKKVADADLDLARQATNAQAEQSQNWKEEHLEELIDAAKEEETK